MAPVKSDIDRGWAFIVVLCNVLAQILIFGISYSSAIFYVTFLDHFDLSPSLTAWVVTLNTCCTYMFGPVGSLLYRHLGPRVSIVLGALLSSLGLAVTGLASDILLTFFSFGVATGFGWAVVYVSIYARTADYFLRYRKMALATSSTGIALGQLAYPPLLTFLFDRLAWFGAFLVLAGLNLNLLAVAAAMMPPRTGRHAAETPRPHHRGSRVQRAVAAAAEDLPLLRNSHFLLLIASTLVAGLAVSAFLTHITSAAVCDGHPALRASMLPSVVGVASLAGRLGLGLVAQHPRVKVVVVNMASFAGIGLASVVTAFCRTYSAFLACSLVFGFFLGVWGLLPELVIVVVGLEKLSGGLGVIGFFSAIGLLCGGPFAGLLFESDPSYRLSFLLCAVLSVASSLLLIPVALRRRERRQSMAADVVQMETQGEREKCLTAGDE